MAHEYFCAQERIKEYLQTLVCRAIVNSDWEEIQNLMLSEVLTKEIFLDLFYFESNNEFLVPVVPLSFFLFKVHTLLDLFEKVLDFVGDDRYNRSFDNRPESIMMLIIFDMIKDDTEGNKLRYDLVKLLLKKCVKISAKTKAKEVFEVLELLIDLGGKELVLQKSSYNGDTSLHTAFRLNADRDVIQLLLEIGGQDVVMECNQHKETSLYVAIENNADSDIVESLLDKGTQNQVLKTEDNGNTPLHLACIQGADEKILELLLRNHCCKQIEMQNDMGQPALHLLIEHNPCLDRMKLLAKKGGKNILFVRDDHDSNLLNIACIVKCLPIIEYLAKEIPSLARKRNQCGETILHSLLYQFEKHYISLEFVQMALDATGQRLWTAQDKYGNTLLHNYVKSINKEQCINVWKLLVDRCGGDLIQIQNIDGNTVLHYYFEGGDDFSMEIVKLMLDAATDKDIVGVSNESGDTRIHEVCRSETSTVDILGAIMNRAVNRKELVLRKGSFNKTALHNTCSHPDNHEIVEYLVNLGGRDLVEAIDNLEKTAGEYNDYQTS